MIDDYCFYESDVGGDEENENRRRFAGAPSTSA
jgi:hypothetical protein